MSEARPPHFAPGSAIGQHYSVEGLVRLSEGRMFYLVNDNRPDRPTRKCWDCGSDDTPRTGPRCLGCGAELKDRRFLVSSRWDVEAFAAYEAFVSRDFRHPGLAGAVHVWREQDQLLSAIPYNGEVLMIDESAPLSNARVLDLAQRVAGTVAYLSVHGVRLKHINRANVLIAPDNSVRLYDVDVAEVAAGPITNGQLGGELGSLAEMLRRYCDVEAIDVAEFLEAVQTGENRTPTAFGRVIEENYEDWAAATYRPLIGAQSDVGLTRQLNEDNWGWRKLSSRSTLFVVADGMGGHDSGEVASALAVETITRVAKDREITANPGLDAIENLLDEAFQTANNTIKDQADERGTDMGTTLVSMLVVEGRLAFVANVGDSRAYLLRNQSLHQISRDHSLVAKMVERGKITAEEARNHPHSNILLRTVGTERDVEIDIFRVELEPGDRVLLCTDGLWGEVEDRDIERILNHYSDPRAATRELTRAAHHGGGKDNVTMLVVAIP